ncbi:MAG: hypothetical protein WEB58_08830 [Planctomycetaceae bacterium]
MTESLSIQCPACSATLKLKNRDALGKRAPCPKCKQPFVLELPASVAVAEIVDDWEEDEFDAAASEPQRPNGSTATDEFDDLDDLDFDRLPKATKASAVKTALPPKKKSVSADKPKKKKAKRVYEDREPGGIGMAVTFGLIAGGIGAFIWGGIGYFTGYEIGWLAWGIGAACGAAVGAGSGAVDEFVSGMIAVVCALGSIALGKYLIVYFLMQKLVAEFGAELADVLQADISILEVMKMTLGPFDILWVILAAGSAYKLGSGNGGD